MIDARHSEDKLLELATPVIGEAKARTLLARIRALNESQQSADDVAGLRGR